MANRRYTQFFQTLETVPVLLSCNFIVDSANGNGLGIRSLKGPGIQAVYMHTSSTPAAGNPNPASGTILIQLQDNYNRSLSGGFSIVAPLSGSAVKIDNSAMTAGIAYTITTLGDATAAAWLALGVPAGITPQVGVSFVALNAGTAGNTSTSRVMATAATGSGVASIETVGDPNTTIAPYNTAPIGAQIIVQCRDYAGALVAPTDGSVIGLSFYLSNSSLKVQGE